MNDQLSVTPAMFLEPTDAGGSEEIVELRRANSKVYDIGDGRRELVAGAGHVHYKNDYNDPGELWKDIDLTIDQDGYVTTAPYQLQIHLDRIGYSYISRRGGRVDIELVEVGHAPVNNQGFTIRIQGNQLFYDGVDTDLDMQVYLRSLSCEIFKRLSSAAAPRHYRWLVREWRDRPLFSRKTLGGDGSDDGRLEILTSVQQLTGTAEYDEFYYDEEWTGRISKVVDGTLRLRQWRDETYVVYPAIIDAVANENIVADVDDGCEAIHATSWITNVNSSKWYLGIYAGGGVSYHGGVRFQTLGVPQGSTINSATLTFNVIGNTNNPQATIYGDDVDTAAAWSNGNLPSGITKTTANVNWTPTATGSTTLNISGIVQEIISRPGWSSGNNIRFGVLRQQTTGTFFATIYDYAAGQPSAARLSVDYTPPPVTRTPRYGFTLYQTPAIV